MPKTRVVFYKDEDGNVPFLDWFETIVQRAQTKCLVRLERLRELGHELRRPEADYLRDGIYELRAQHNRVNYRILYFYHGQQAVVVSHGITKQRADVPSKEIDRATKRMSAYRRAPAARTHEE